MDFRVEDLGVQALGVHDEEQQFCCRRGSFVDEDAFEMGF